MLQGLNLSQKSRKQIRDDRIRLILQAGVQLGDHQLKFHDQRCSVLLDEKSEHFSDWAL